MGELARGVDAFPLDHLSRALPVQVALESWNRALAIWPHGLEPGDELRAVLARSLANDLWAQDLRASARSLGVPVARP